MLVLKTLGLKANSNVVVVQVVDTVEEAVNFIFKKEGISWEKHEGKVYFFVNILIISLLLVRFLITFLIKMAVVRPISIGKKVFLNQDYNLFTFGVLEEIYFLLVSSAN